MKINFRHGIIDLPNRFLTLNSDATYIDLNIFPAATDSVTKLTATIANNDSDYLFVEDKSVTKAWGPCVDKSKTYFLYWEIDQISGMLSRKTTDVEPVISESQPAGVNGLIWFNPVNKTSNYFNGVKWYTKLILIAASYKLGDLLPNIKAVGSQLGLNVPANPGFIVLDAFGKTFKNLNGELLTTETELISSRSFLSDKYDRGEIFLYAGENIPKFSSVYINEGKVFLANPSQGKQPIGLVLNPTSTNKLCEIVVSKKIVSSDQWHFTTEQIGKKLYSEINGVLTLDKPVDKNYVVVATILDANTIITEFDYTCDPFTATGGPGAMGDKGPTGPQGDKGATGAGGGTFVIEKQNQLDALPEPNDPKQYYLSAVINDPYSQSANTELNEGSIFRWDGSGGISKERSYFSLINPEKTDGNIFKPRSKINSAEMSEEELLGQQGGSSFKINQGGFFEFHLPAQNFKDIEFEREFTIESFIYCTDLSHSNPIFSKVSNQNNAGVEYEFFISSTGSLNFYTGIRGNNQTIYDFGFQIQTNKWYHVAVTRDTDGQLRAFLNGQMSLGVIDNTKFIGGINSHTIGIGRDTEFNSDPFAGYMDCLRVTKKCLYLDHFRLPRLEFIGPQEVWVDIYYRDVVLLMTFDNDNKFLEDLSLNHNSMVRFNNLITQNKYNLNDDTLSTGTCNFSSSYFDYYYGGNGDVIYNENPIMGALSADFTIEFWIKLLSTDSFGCVFTNQTSSSDANSITIFEDGRVVQGTMNIMQPLPNEKIKYDVWQHHAYYRSGGTLYHSLNGKLERSCSSTNNYPGDIFYIGGDFHNNGMMCSGELDNLRITKMCRYPANDWGPVPKRYPLNGHDMDSFIDKTIFHLTASVPDMSPSIFNDATSYEYTAVPGSAYQMISIGGGGIARVDTDNPKFEKASLLFNGDVSYHSMTGPTPTHLGSLGPFTIEFWIKPQIEFQFLLSGVGSSSGDTSLVDESDAPKNITRMGTDPNLVTYSNGNTLYGGNSIRFQNDSFVGIDNGGVSEDLNLSNKDFTIECWVYVPTDGFADYHGIFDTRSGGQGIALTIGSPVNNFTVSIWDNSNFIGDNEVHVVAESWNHISVNRASNGAITVFVNGYMSLTLSDIRTYSRSGYFLIGSTIDNKPLDSYLADFQIIVGYQKRNVSFNAAPNTRTAKKGDSLIIGSQEFSNIPASWAIRKEGLNIKFKASTNQSNWELEMETGNVLSYNQWTHFALTWDNESFARMFINGILLNNTVQFDGYTFVPHTFLNVGVSINSLDDYFIGSLDDIRITNGAARYTENFKTALTRFYSHGRDPSLNQFSLDNLIFLKASAFNVGDILNYSSGYLGGPIVYRSLTERIVASSEQSLFGESVPSYIQTIRNSNAGSQDFEFWGAEVRITNPANVNRNYAYWLGDEWLFTQNNDYVTNSGWADEPKQITVITSLDQLPNPSLLTQAQRNNLVGSIWVTSGSSTFNNSSNGFPRKFKIAAGSLTSSPVQPCNVIWWNGYSFEFREFFNKKDTNSNLVKVEIASLSTVVSKNNLQDLESALSQPGVYLTSINRMPYEIDTNSDSFKLLFGAGFEYDESYLIPVQVTSAGAGYKRVLKLIKA